MARPAQQSNRGRAGRTRTSSLAPGHIDQIYGTIRTLIRCLMWLGIARYGFAAVESLAGKSTTLLLSWGLDVVADWRVSISVTLAGFAGLWALLERRVRQRTVERLHRRINELETKVDPNRSTSSLTPRGTTNPRDRE